MHRAAWCLTDLSSLWEPANQRGANVIIPEVAGRRAYPRKVDETDYALPFLISGLVDETGAFTGEDENEQLRENLAYLRQYVLDPSAGATRPAQLKSPDASVTLTADVQVMPLVTRYRQAGIWAGTLHLVIPAGSFA